MERYAVVGRYMNGTEVTHYHVQIEGVGEKKITRELLCFLVGKGLVVNCEGWAGEDDVRLAGTNGTKLSELPAFNENRCDDKAYLAIRESVVSCVHKRIAEILSLNGIKIATKETTTNHEIIDERSITTEAKNKSITILIGTPIAFINNDKNTVSAWAYVGEGSQRTTLYETFMLVTLESIKMRGRLEIMARETAASVLKWIGELPDIRNEKVKSVDWKCTNALNIPRTYAVGELTKQISKGIKDFNITGLSVRCRVNKGKEAETWIECSINNELKAVIMIGAPLEQIDTNEKTVTVWARRGMGIESSILIKGIALNKGKSLLDDSIKSLCNYTVYAMEKELTKTENKWDEIESKRAYVANESVKAICNHLRAERKVPRLIDRTKDYSLYEYEIDCNIDGNNSIAYIKYSGEAVEIEVKDGHNTDMTVKIDTKGQLVELDGRIKEVAERVADCMIIRS